MQAHIFFRNVCKAGKHLNAEMLMGVISRKMYPCTRNYWKLPVNLLKFWHCSGNH